MNATGRRLIGYGVLLSALLVLAGCGGGGGGNGGGGGAGSASGQFSLSTHSLSFVARENQALPLSQHIVLQLSSAGAALVIAGWPAGSSAPGWVSVQIDQESSTTANVQVSITSIPQSVGQYTATLVLETTDSNNNVLNQENVQLSYTVETGLGIASANSQPTAYQGSGPQNLGLEVSNPHGVAFTVSSSASWLTVPAGTQSASGQIQAQINPAGLTPGTYTATATATDSGDSTDSAATTITLTVLPLNINLSASPVTLGGTDGNGADTATEMLTITPIGSGSSASWVASVSSQTGGSWLSIASGSGTLTPAQDTSYFTLAADIGALQGGTYTASVDIMVTIGGQVIHRALPVTLNRSAEKLLVSSNGVAFSKFPSSSLLTRTLGVYDTDGTITVPWTATSDSSWLSVTSSGTTGSGAVAGNLVLTADPTGLTADQEHSATVTISTTDGVISNQEKIRVGLWVGSSDPQADTVTPPAPTNLQNLPAITTDPVEPYAFLSEGDTDIFVYNVYTGALVTTYSNVGQSVGAMAVSGDGSTLYVEDTGTNSIVPVAVDTGTAGTPYALHAGQLSNQEALAYGKVADEPMVVSGSGFAVDLATGAEISGIGGIGAWVAISPDGHTVTALDKGAFPSTLYYYAASYSSLTGGITLTPFGGGSAGNSIGLDLAAAMDTSGNALIVAADAAISDIEVGPPDGTLTLLPVPVSPNSVAVGWNGVIAAGLEFSSGLTSNIYVYSASGSLLGTANASPSAALTGRTVRLSGDATRMTAMAYSSGYVLDFLSVP